MTSLFDVISSGIIIDAVGALHGAAELQASRDDATTPIIDQITAQQIAGSAMFGTLESMRNTDMQNVSTTAAIHLA